ncbi:MAG: hypothetical protein V4478_04030 [Patescibacteria group bacterium]
MTERIHSNHFNSPEHSSSQERQFSQESIREDLAKFNLAGKELKINTKTVSVEGLVKVLYEQQGVNPDTQQEKEVNDAIVYMKQFPSAASEQWMPWEIKQELLKYNLPNDIFNYAARAISATAPAKGGERFPEQQTDALKTSHAETLEGTTITMEDMLANPALIHVVGGTYRGNGIWKLFQGGVDKTSSSTDNVLGIAMPDLGGMSLERDQELFGDGTPFRAQPVTFRFPQGEGYGFVYPKYDDLDRLGFGTFFVIVPEDQHETANFIKNNPDILVRLFQEKLHTGNDGRELDESAKWGRKLELRNKNFIAIE